MSLKMCEVVNFCNLMNGKIQNYYQKLILDQTHMKFAVAMVT